MNYILFDLEFNQEITSKDKNVSSSNLTFEIIQIGALKLNNNLEVISTFNKYIKPTEHKEIHPFVENLTKITTSMVEHEDYFNKVYTDFVNFIGPEDFTFCVWGVSDIKELIRNIKFHNIDLNDTFKSYIDVQSLASTPLKIKKGEKAGLKTAVEYFNISAPSQFHDAFNDAYYTAEVFRKLYTKKVKPSIYIDNKKRKANENLKVDNDKLLAQFEKMLNKELTKEEKMIIKLAYNMGKTHQFLKK